VGASERDEKARSTWRDRVRELDPKKLIFVDECGTNISLTTLYGRAPKGQRALGKAPRNWGKNLTLIASLSLEGLSQRNMVVEGATDTRAFETYVEHFLCANLKKGEVVIVDNLSAHKGERIRTLNRIEGSAPVVPASLLSRLQPHRGSLLQAEELPKGRGKRGPRSRCLKP
jgi:hypothetical protein